MTDMSDRDLRILTAGNCPDCQARGFVLGPRGGVAQNIECANLKCRSRFNVVTFGGKVLMAQRIEKEDEGGYSWPSSGARDAAPPKGSFS